MDIMAGARIGRAIVVSSVREAAASVPRRGGGSAVHGTGCDRLLLRAAPSASGASHRFHSLAAGRNAGDRNRRVSL